MSHPSKKCEKCNKKMELCVEKCGTYVCSNYMCSLYKCCEGRYCRGLICDKCVYKYGCFYHEDHMCVNGCDTFICKHEADFYCKNCKGKLCGASDCGYKNPDGICDDCTYQRAITYPKLIHSVNTYKHANKTLNETNKNLKRTIAMQNNSIQRYKMLCIMSKTLYIVQRYMKPFLQ